MQTLTLLLALDVQAPPGGTLGHDVAARSEQVLIPLVALLEEYPEVRCALHVGGRLVDWLHTHRPPEIARLRALIQAGRVELLGSGFFEPLLAAIPERDATGQLQLMNSMLTEQFAVKPPGVWLTGRAWDPALPGLLNRAGFQYTLVDEQHFLASDLGHDDLDGYHITEREGFPLAVFPIHTELQRQLMGTESGQRHRVLQRYLGAREQRSALLSFDDLRRPEQLEPLAALFAELREQRHWIKNRTCREVLDKQPATGRVYLPTVVRAEGLDDSLEGLGWERFLVEYPEANNLHKRMLMASYRVQRMRIAVQEQVHRVQEAARRDELRGMLQQACMQLWSAQNHAVYWHGGGQAGLYDPRLRSEAYGNLLRCERLANRLLRERTEQDFVTRAVDFDCDGHHELLVDAGAVAAIIAPRWGGGMLSFDILEREVGLGNVLQRHEEPYHFFSATDDIQLVDDDAATVDYTESAAYTPEQAARLWFDARPRMAFVEHFLGAGTTLDSWYRGRYRDVGDFADGAYEIAKTLKLPDEGEGLVHLGRSGTVEENGQRSLVRLEKSFVFTLSDPRLRVDYHLINRYFEPVRAWLGVEANLALPGTGEGSVPRFRVVGSGGEQEGELQGPLAMERVGYLELIDADHDLVVCVYLDEPRDVWMMPVETLQRIHGDVTLFPQGLSLLIHGDHDLWGSEEQQFSVRLEFLEY